MVEITHSHFEEIKKCSLVSLTVLFPRIAGAQFLLALEENEYRRVPSVCNNVRVVGAIGAASSDCCWFSNKAETAPLMKAIDGGASTAFSCVHQDSATVRAAEVVDCCGLY